MCGFVGGIFPNGPSISIQQVEQATQVLQHRGPSDTGFYASQNNTAVFGHCRLCIIDLTSAAAQPMQFANRYHIIFNGEIYNYLEIKKDLEKQGYVFRSHSDTEVLLLAFVAYGKDCLQQLDGAFAFAIWDDEEQTLFAARDRFGEKPFFFSYNNQQLLFASEIKAFWPLGVAKTVNEAMLYNFLTIGYTCNPSDPRETFYEHISKLPAAHFLTYSTKHNTLQLERFWEVDVEKTTSLKEDEVIEQFASLLQESIHKKMRSDVPIGTSLSGGLDSSSIVALCATESSKQYSHHCFTASFKGFEKDEGEKAALIAQQFGLQHTLTTIKGDDVVNLMEKVALQQDEPFSSASVLAQYKVFETAKQHGITVMLDGQGADEILAGYHHYYKWYWQELYREKKLSSSGELAAARALAVTVDFGIKNKVAALLPEFSASILQTIKAKNSFKQNGLHPQFAFSNKRQSFYSTPTNFTLNGALYFNSFINGLEELLRLADRNSMAHGVEARLPFLQHQLVEFLFSLPPHFKIRNGYTKWLLRKAMETKLPREITWQRGKTGYEPPQKLWMNDKNVQEAIREGKKKLVEARVLSASVLKQPIKPTAAFEANNFDWRYWSASYLF